MGLGHYIANKWIEGAGEEFCSHDPSTGIHLWMGKKATKEEVDLAIDAAEEAFPSWSSLSINERFSFLKQFESHLTIRKELVAKAIASDTGKPWWESLQEVDAMIRKVRISFQAYQERCPEKKVVFPGGTLFTRYRPHGVVGVLGPFNFPGHIPNGHIIPALLAGNTVVFKSSDLAPLAAEEIVRCWQMTDLPPGVINLLQGCCESGRLLASHPKLNGLFFTGSYQAGASLMELFALHPEKILALEMGGNNPLVVADISDYEAAAYLTIQSAFLTSGQRCSCARRLIVVEGKEGDEFLKTLSHMTQTLNVGSFVDRPEPFMGPVIHTKSMENLLSVQSTFILQGAIPLVEMRALKEGTSLLSPGLIDVTSLSHRPDEEFFGPLLQVIKVPNFESAIQEANKTQFGLTSGIFTKNEEKYRQFFNEVKAGVINWNTPTTGSSSEAPFGGVKKSGNYRPSAYFACDYCTYAAASMESPDVRLPKHLTPGVQFLAKT